MSEALSMKKSAKHVSREIGIKITYYKFRSMVQRGKFTPVYSSEQGSWFTEKSLNRDIQRHTDSKGVIVL